jgi:hypothetical protein
MILGLVPCSPVMRRQLRELPAAKSTLLLDQAGGAPGGDLLTPIFVDSLRKAGFALASNGSKIGDAHIVRYLITPSPEGILIRLTVDQWQSSEFMLRNEMGGLMKMPVAVWGTEP